MQKLDEKIKRLISISKNIIDEIKEDAQVNEVEKKEGMLLLDAIELNASRYQLLEMLQTKSKYLED